MIDLKETLTLGSLFDGSGGFPLAGILAGIKPIWASEIAPFPTLVTHRRLPEVKHYGDINDLKGDELGAVDIITFGSPCVDLSIAGQRAGIHAPRSGLFFQAVRIIKEMRNATNGKYPRFIVWENVASCQSSSGGEDFRIVLEEICKVKREVSIPRPDGKWTRSGEIVDSDFSLAWRTLDAQYWGVPQRRSRIYLVADFAGQSAGKILFEREGMSGYSPPSCVPWQSFAGNPEDRSGETDKSTLCLNPQGSSGLTVTENQTGTLVSQDHGNHPAVLQSAGFCTEHSADSRGIGYEEEKSPTLRAGIVPAAVLYDNHAQDGRYDELDTAPTVTARYGTGGNNTPLVAEPQTAPENPMVFAVSRVGYNGGEKANFAFAVNEDVSPTIEAVGPPAVAAPEIKAFGICGKTSFSMESDNPSVGFYEAKTSKSLDQSCGNPTCNQGGIAVVAPAYSLQGSMIGRKEKNGPVGSGVDEEISFTLNTVDRHGVCCATTGSRMSVSEDVASTLCARDWKDPPIVCNYIVRRLTPLECSRLQGFPDWWCDDLAIPDPSPEEMEFWKDVWETWRKATRPDGKPKTEKQIRKWLANPYTDNAAYSMWGNGVALPCPYFVLSGIVDENEAMENAGCAE